MNLSANIRVGRMADVPIGISDIRKRLDGILPEIIGKATAAIFQIGFSGILPVKDVTISTFHDCRDVFIDRAFDRKQVVMYTGILGGSG